MKFRLKSVDSSVSIPSWFDLKDYFGSNHRLNSFGSYIIGVNFLRYNALIYTIMVYQLVCIIGVSSDVLIQNSRKNSPSMPFKMLENNHSILDPSQV